MGYLREIFTVFYFHFYVMRNRKIPLLLLLLSKVRFYITFICCSLLGCFYTSDYSEPHHSIEWGSQCWTRTFIILWRYALPSPPFSISGSSRSVRSSLGTFPLLWNAQLVSRVANWSCRPSQITIRTAYTYRNHYKNSRGLVRWHSSIARTLGLKTLCTNQ